MMFGFSAAAAMSTILNIGLVGVSTHTRRVSGLIAANNGEIRYEILRLYAAFKSLETPA